MRWGGNSILEGMARMSYRASSSVVEIYSLEVRRFSKSVVLLNDLYEFAVRVFGQKVIPTYMTSKV